MKADEREVIQGMNIQDIMFILWYLIFVLKHIVCACRWSLNRLLFWGTLSRSCSWCCHQDSKRNMVLNNSWNTDKTLLTMVNTLNWQSLTILCDHKVLYGKWNYMVRLSVIATVKVTRFLKEYDNLTFLISKGKMWTVCNYNIIIFIN